MSEVHELAIVARPAREGRALDRDAPVALDERDDDVLAAQAGQQVGAGGVAEGVDGGCLRERLLVLDPGVHLAHLVEGKTGRAGRGEGCAGHELHAGDGRTGSRRPRAS